MISPSSEQIRSLNRSVGWAVSDFLCGNPRCIDSDLLEQMLPLCPDEQTAFRNLLAACLGMDIEGNELHRFMYDRYLVPGVNKLQADVFRNNPYYKNIAIDQVKNSSWQLSWQEYAPYEVFLSDDLILDGDYEIPSIGYFSESFRFPSVLQDGREWMSIKPSEIVTSQPAVDRARGRVVTFGLGLGYFVYMALLKSEVENVTVVELDERVIELFKAHILPQFPRACDVRIVCADAFEYLEKEMRDGDFDFAFADIWHDISDGTESYVRMRNASLRFQNTEFSYWIERSLRCALAATLLETGRQGKLPQE